MDADKFKASVEYERLTQAVYQSVLAEENIEVQHDQSVEGRSGVEHQIDVLWRFRQATVWDLTLGGARQKARNIRRERQSAWANAG